MLTGPLLKSSVVDGLVVGALVVDGLVVGALDAVP